MQRRGGASGGPMDGLGGSSLKRLRAAETAAAPPAMPRPMHSPVLGHFWWWGGTGVNLLAGLHRLRARLECDDINQLHFVLSPPPLSWVSRDYPHLRRLANYAAPGMPAALPDLEVAELVVGWRSVAGQRELHYPGGGAEFWARLQALQAAQGAADAGSPPAWVVVPLLLDGQYPAAIPAAALAAAPYGQAGDGVPVAELEECHASVLVLELPSGPNAAWRGDRLDSYQADPPGNGWAKAPGETALAAAAETGRYECWELDRQLGAELATVLGRLGCYHGVAETASSKGPQDWEEGCDLQDTAPGGTDGLGFCLAWCLALAEFRIRNSLLSSESLVRNFVDNHILEGTSNSVLDSARARRVYQYGRDVAHELVKHRDAALIGAMLKGGWREDKLLQDGVGDCASNDWDPARVPRAAVARAARSLL